MNRTVWIFPIEPFEERYTAQWLEWFDTRFRKYVDTVAIVHDARWSYGAIASGEFLDVIGTHIYKARQLAAFAEEVARGNVKNGDTVLFLDAWNPAVQSVAYIRDGMGLDIKLVGCVHAGTWDPADFLSRKGMAKWAKPSERGMLKCLDSICVATKCHAEMIEGYFGEGLPLVVTGFPLYDEEFVEHALLWTERPRLVVFPHRLAPEKDPEGFRVLEETYRERYSDESVKFVRTRDVCESKLDYYRLLGQARAVFSSARQETWGIAMLEGALLGAHPVSPQRLSYPEVHGEERTFCDFSQAADMVRAALDAEAPHEHARRDDWRDKAMRQIAAQCRG